MPVMTSPGQESEYLNAQLLVDSIPALIHTARPDGYLDYFNKRWLEYLGVTLDKVIGWNWTSVIHPQDVEGIVAEWRACLATGEIFEYETRVRRAGKDLGPHFRSLFPALFSAFAAHLLHDFRNQIGIHGLDWSLLRRDVGSSICPEGYSVFRPNGLPLPVRNIG